MNRTARNRLIQKFKRGCKGIAAVEFALTLSIWMTLLLGVADGSYYLLINERVDRISYTVSDIVTQYQTKTTGQESTLTLSKLADIMLGAVQLMQPISFNPDGMGTMDPETGQYPAAVGYIIVTSVYKDPDTGLSVVKWQYAYPPSGNGVSMPPSQIGPSTPGSPTYSATPDGLALNDRDNVIFTEVYYTFSPLFLDQFISRVIYRVAAYKPRLSPLINAPT